VTANLSRALNIMKVVYYPKPTPAFSNSLAYSIRLGRYPQGPGSAGSSSVPTLGLLMSPLNFLM